jgi:hypothetical protein
MKTTALINSIDCMPTNYYENNRRLYDCSLNLTYNIDNIEYDKNIKFVNKPMFKKNNIQKRSNNRYQHNLYNYGKMILYSILTLIFLIYIYYSTFMTKKKKN